MVFDQNYKKNNNISLDIKNMIIFPIDIKNT